MRGEGTRGGGGELVKSIDMRGVRFRDWSGSVAIMHERGGWVGVPVEGSSAVEELQVKWGCGLAVDFAAWASLHGHG